jgi:hypothetical protein
MSITLDYIQLVPQSFCMFVMPDFIRSPVTSLPPSSVRWTPVLRFLRLPSVGLQTPETGLPPGPFVCLLCRILSGLQSLKTLETFPSRGPRRIFNSWGERRQWLHLRFSRAVSSYAIHLPNAKKHRTPFGIRCKGTAYFWEWLGKFSQFFPNFFPIIC